LTAGCGGGAGAGCGAGWGAGCGGGAGWGATRGAAQAASRHAAATQVIDFRELRMDMMIGTQSRLAWSARDCTPSVPSRHTPGHRWSG